MNIPFEPYVPMKSLKYKCLSQLTSMMRQSESEQEARKSTSSSSCKQESTSENPTPSTSQSQPKNALLLPIEVVQLILDHIVQERIPIRHEVLCALLDNGGCFSLHFWDGFFQCKFNDEEKTAIFNILVRNPDHLTKFSSLLAVFPDYKVIYPIQDFASIKLKYLSCTIDTLESIIHILSAFPNLIELSVRWYWTSPPSTQQMNTVFDALISNSSCNNVRHSLQKLDLNDFGQEPISSQKPRSLYNLTAACVIRLISCFPNLIKLGSNNLTDNLWNTLLQAQNSEYSEDIDVKGLKVSATELKNVVRIFSRLQVFNFDSYSHVDIVVLFPNLRELTCNYHFSNIVNLKFIKRLCCMGFFGESILPRIGHHLESLRLHSHENVLTIARYCPNLKDLSLAHDLSAPDENPSMDRLYSNVSEQERENLKRSFRHLKKVNILICRDENIVYYILESAVDIEHIGLYGCEITAEKLKKLIEINPMKNLRVLAIGDHDEPPLMSQDDLNQLSTRFDKMCYAKCISMKADG